MAKPRVFISSTYYDLKHIRSALGVFIDSLGYESVMNERGVISYSHTEPLDESCYEEVKQCDIMVLIIGGRYGSPESSEKNTVKKKKEELREKRSDDFFLKYKSVTRKECETALDENIPLYVFIEKAVHIEYETYLVNEKSTSIKYAQVSSVNVFEMIKEIDGLPLNNIIKPFEHSYEIEDWLRSQWSGLFKDLLNKKSSQAQLESLSSQVTQLNESNKTLRRYLETLMSGKNKTESKSIIDQESKRLKTLQIKEVLSSVSLGNALLKSGLSPLEAFEVIKSNTVEEFANKMIEINQEHEIDVTKESTFGRFLSGDYSLNEETLKEFNSQRNQLIEKFDQITNQGMVSS
ncbi:hypothetical protein CA11_33030 [Gimesia maris]|uniref:DUF4062 domain-containing protein n=1 Tax=Gimesia maris TaxID=122 RepID=UPI00118AC74E|nr:DUF4062 domain-containing protein [Gimesia maris]QDU15478.1 hypothetical protein CA11_33030 [Gimesia maris]